MSSLAIPLSFSGPHRREEKRESGFVIGFRRTTTAGACFAAITLLLFFPFAAASGTMK
jgi:hypothetical protein